MRKKQNLVGLDLGSHTVKIAHLNADKGPPTLLNFGLATLPDRAFAEGKLRDPGLVVATIQKLSKHLKIKEKSVAISISGYEVMIKKIDLPLMTEEELGSRMHEQLGQYIPYSIDEVNIDYQILGMVKNRPKAMEVLLVAAKKDSISDYADMVREAGFDPLVIDIDCFALSNAHEATYGASEETVALVDIGANKASIYVLNAGNPVFTRDISIGGFQITDAIRGRYRLPYEEAEQIKLGRPSETAPVKELADIFLTVANEWVAEVKRVIDFFYGNYPEDKIGKLFLSGGSSRIPGLDKLFGKKTGIEAEIFNPLSRLEYDSRRFDPAYIKYIGSQMAVCLGLALRKANEK